MEFFICRTCLKDSLIKANCVLLSSKAGSNQLTIKDMLEVFMPEMDLDVTEREAVICFQCVEALKNAYLFKNTCLKTEEKVYDYLQKYNIELGKKIDLINIIDHENLETTFTSFNDCSLTIEFNDLSHFAQPESKKLAQNNTHSSQNTSDTRIDILQPTEIKNEISVPKTRKRRGRKRSIPDYSSLKRSYTCDLCEYKAYRLDLLNTHKQKHDKNILNVKEYKCDLCLYSTTRKRALDRHLFTHKGQSPHLCEICKKTFAEKYQLKLHSITHSGQELPHKCQQCGKGYLTKSYLKQHMETQHLAKNNKCEKCNEENCEHGFSRFYKCNTCEASFSDKRGLDAHKFTHSGAQLPFKCLHCDFSTAWKGNLKKHLHNKHK